MTRLSSIDAVTAIVGDEIRAAIIPGLEHYPALVYTVLSNVPQNSAMDGSSEYTMKLRLAALCLGQSVPAPYDTVWKLAMAGAGDAEAEAGPTGLNGWKDSERSIWLLDDMLDESGPIESGTDTFWAYVVNLFFTVQWKYSAPST